jgi:1,4-alpha-glucan branching enzyme
MASNDKETQNTPLKAARKPSGRRKKGDLPENLEPKPLPEEEEGQAAESWSLLTDFDIYLFREGRHHSLHQKLGAHIRQWQGQQGVVFAVWAPNAQEVSVIGSFNGWNRHEHRMHVRLDGSGIWELFIPDIGHGEIYKYFIRANNGYEVEKADPFAFYAELPPSTASVVWDLSFKWNDGPYRTARKKKAGKAQPMSVYEMHLASWRRVWEEDNRSLTYRELAGQLVDYLKEAGFTHVEFMPVMEHPFGGSWGYQVTGFFSPTSRLGTPQEFMYLVNELHRAGIGVILDWVPSHYPGDLHGLFYFDGTNLFEHSDPRQGFHPDWNSYIFNYGRNEIKCFLISSALFWLDMYHADGIRVDAVASMLYLDYSRNQGEWIPNQYGGNENLEAIQFMKELNEAIYHNFPDVHTIAEESTAWPGVSRPVYAGGLGFGQKWMMGWMHDTLQYFSRDPVYRTYHQNEITFSLNYAFTENFMLPLSHDEVVYGKGALIQKMPGDEWQRFANLRLLYGYMWSHPGTKLLFMGCEFGQTSEWNHDGSLDWHLLQYEFHKGVLKMMGRLNEVYKTETALYEIPFEQEGFEWIDYNDYQNSVISYLRKDRKGNHILVICNFTPAVRENYTLGVPQQGSYLEIFNSDAREWGGSGVVNQQVVEVMPLQNHGREFSVSVTLPPLGVTYLRFQKKAGAAGRTKAVKPISG